MVNFLSLIIKLVRGRLKKNKKNSKKTQLNETLTEKFEEKFSNIASLANSSGSRG